MFPFHYKFGSSFVFTRVNISKVSYFDYSNLRMYVQYTIKDQIYIFVYYTIIQPQRKHAVTTMVLLTITKGVSLSLETSEINIFSRFKEPFVKTNIILLPLIFEIVFELFL